MPRTALLFLVFLPWLAAGEPPPPSPGPSEIRETIEQLGTPDFERRDAAFERLLEWGRKDPHAVLPELPAEHPDMDVASRCAILRARIAADAIRTEALLAAAGSPKLEQAIASFLDAPSAETLEALLAAAQRVRDARAVRLALLPHLDSLFKSLDKRVRARTVPLLTFLEPAESLPYFDRAIGDSEPRVRYLGFEAMRTRAADVKSCLESPDPAVREAAKVLLDALDAWRKQRKNLSTQENPDWKLGR